MCTLTFLRQLMYKATVCTAQDLPLNSLHLEDILSCLEHCSSKCYSFEGLSSLCSNSRTLKYMLESFYLAWIAFICFGKLLASKWHFTSMVKQERMSINASHKSNYLTSLHFFILNLECNLAIQDVCLANVCSNCCRNQAQYGLVTCCSIQLAGCSNESLNLPSVGLLLSPHTFSLHCLYYKFNCH